MKALLPIPALLLAMPAQAATLAIPEYHTFTQSVPCYGMSTSFCCSAGGVSTMITLIHLGEVVTFKQLIGGWNTVLAPDWNDPTTDPRYIIKTFGDGASVTFYGAR